MLNGLAGYWSGIPWAWGLSFIAARICYVAHHGFLPAFEDGWWEAAKAATVLGVLWPLPVLLVVAALVWLLPPSRIVPTPQPTAR